MYSLHPIALLKSRPHTFFTGSVKSYGGAYVRLILVVTVGVFSLFARSLLHRYPRYGGRAAFFTVHPIYGGAHSTR